MTLVGAGVVLAIDGWCCVIHVFEVDLRIGILLVVEFQGCNILVSCYWAMNVIYIGLAWGMCLNGSYGSSVK